MKSKRKRLAVLASHPVQYQSPLFRTLAKHIDTTVLYAAQSTRKDQADAGFGTEFEWDVDLTEGFESRFLDNTAATPTLSSFWGVDTPGIGAHLDSIRPDALLVLGWHFKAYIQGTAAARRRRIPTLVRGDSQLQTPRSATRRALKELIYPVALRSFSAALYVGERSRSYYEHYKFPRDRMFFSPHCVDARWFAKRATPEAGAKLRAKSGIEKTARVVLFAGKLIEKKRPLDVVRACARIRSEGGDVVLLIAGSGPLEAAVRQLAKECNVPIVILGFCNQTEMPATYAASDLLVLPSDAGETWGLVANEAIASGVPIVVSDACGCAPDLVDVCRAGLRVSLGDVSALAKAVMQVLDGPPSMNTLNEASERHSLQSAAKGVHSALLALEHS